MKSLRIPEVDAVLGTNMTKSDAIQDVLGDRFQEYADLKRTAEN